MGGLRVAASSNSAPNTWSQKLANGDIVLYQVLNASTPTAGVQLLISKKGDTANSITINNFDFALAKTSTGYLGIKLDPTKTLTLLESGNTLGANGNPNKNPDFNPASVASVANILEGAGKGYKLFLNQAAKAGETITLAMSGSADTLSAILGDTTVPFANGQITLTLKEEQTEIAFAVVNSAPLGANATASLSATYSSGGGSVSSNAATINLVDAAVNTKHFLRQARRRCARPMRVVGLKGLGRRMDSAQHGFKFNQGSYPCAA